MRKHHRHSTPVAAAWALAGSLCTSALAADEAGALQDMLVRDAKVTAHLRSYYLDRDKPGNVVNEAWALGGWLGYQSGWLGDVLSFGLVGYVSVPLWAPADTDGTLLLAPGQQGYSVLGQSWAALRFGQQVATGGRFLVNQPEVNPQDNRMTPNTFQGGNLAGKLLGVTYYAAYLNGMKARNSTQFVDMATIAGAPAGVNSPMWLLGFSGAPIKDLNLRLSSYKVPNVLVSSYADAAWNLALSPTYTLRLGAQAMTQNSTGDDALTGASFSASNWGLKGDLSAGPATLTLAYNQNSRGANFLSPYGTWAGYETMIIYDFNKAGEKVVLIGGDYDFAAHGAPGLRLNVAAVFGRDVVNPATGAAAANDTEYDMTLDYRFSARTWPEWARPLWLRARAGRLEQSLGGTTNVTTDYRVILNYNWVF